MIDKEKIKVYVHFDTYIEVRNKILDQIDRKMGELILEENYEKMHKVLNEMEQILALIEETDKKMGLQDEEI